MVQKITSEEKEDIRLLVDAHVFDGIYQGSRTFLKGIYTHLDTEKFNITIYLVANDLDNLEAEFSFDKSIKFIKLRSKNKFIRLAYEIPNIIRKNKIDFAHFNYYLPLFLSKHCKYIVTIHDVLFLDFPQFFPKLYRIKNFILFGYSIRKSDLLNTVSIYSAERIKRKFKLDNNHIIDVIPNAIDEKFLINKSLKETDRQYLLNKYNISNFILYVSRWEPRKNHISILKVYENLELWKKNIEVVFVGKEAIENADLNKTIERLNNKCGGRIKHLQYINQDDLIKINNAALLSVFPSICEGFGIPPLESAVLKTPTICSNNTAMKEFTFFNKYHIDTTELSEIELALNSILQEIKTNSNYESLHIISDNIRANYDWSKSANILGESIIRMRGLNILDSTRKHRI